MCGIVGAVAERNIANILLEGLKRLEYRGYDSAGLTVIRDGELHRERQVGKVQELVNAVAVNPYFFDCHIGIAHTRGRLMASQHSVTHIRTSQVKLPLFITVSSKTMQNLKKRLSLKAMSLPRRLIPKWSPI